MSKSNKSSLKRRQFKAYSKNLETIYPDLSGKFLCPLCRRLFTIEDLDEGKITSEHIIPQAIGGKYTTLTCSTCNNEAGKNLDIELIKRLEIEDIFSGKGSRFLRAKIKGKEGEQTVDMNFSPEDKPHLQFIGLPDQSNPYLQEKLIEEFEKGEGIKIHVEFKAFKKIPSFVAIIRYAYLMMFSFFGYRYILHPNVKIVFDQITNYTEESNVLYGIVKVQEKELGANHVSICRLSSGHLFFLPTLDFSTTTDARYLSFAMPGLGDSDENLYDELKILRDLKGFKITILDTISFKSNYISDPFLPDRIWKYMESIKD